MNSFFCSSYKKKVSESNRDIEVKKNTGSDLVEITSYCNNREEEKIQLQGTQVVELLILMLKQSIQHD